jgi:predicted extracellular nuclease
MQIGAATQQAAKSVPAGGSTSGGAGSLRVAQMNLWNLFDTEDAPAPIRDEQLTPEQYKIKLEKIAAGIVKLGLPDLISANEIENAKVLEDLAATDALKGAGYKVAIGPSNDLRGINVAAMYKGDKLEVVKLEQPNPKMAFPTDAGGGQVDSSLLYPRAPLVVDFRLKGAAAAASQAKDGSDLLRVSINHFKSKLGGDGPEARRQMEGEYLGEWLDKKAKSDPVAATIVLGDLNATYADGAYRNLASRKDGSARFYDAPLRVPEANRYTYWFHNKGDMLDHVLVTSGKEDAIKAVDILHVNAKQNPWKHEWDPKTVTGFSDHDPTVVEFDTDKLMAKAAAPTA